MYQKIIIILLSGLLTFSCSKENRVELEPSSKNDSFRLYKEAYEGYLNTCLMLPNYETCAQTKYENYICGDNNMIKQLQKKAKEAE